MIKGISEIRRFPRLGVIRLGEKKLSGTGKEYPHATDHFVVNDYPEIQGVYGPKPKELEVLFPTDDEEAIFPQWYKRYSSTRGLVCRGDGETATTTRREMVVDEHGKEEEAPIQEEIDCLGQECEFYQEKKCRRVASLKFMLPKVEGMGIWQLNTSSFNSIVNINSMIDLIKTAAKKKGIDFRTILFRLCVEPQETTTGGVKRKIHILQLRTPKGALVAQLEAPRAEIEQKPTEEKGPPKEGKKEEKPSPKVTLEDLKKAANKCKTIDELIGWYRSIEGAAEQQLTDKQFKELIDECASLRITLQNEERKEMSHEAQQLLQYLDEAHTKVEFDHRVEVVKSGKVFKAFAQKEREKLEIAVADVMARLPKG